MRYEKPRATIVTFSNADVVAASGEYNPQAGGGKFNCGHKTSGKSCANNGVQKFDNCKNLNHWACTADLGV